MPSFIAKAWVRLALIVDDVILAPLGFGAVRKYEKAVITDDEFKKTLCRRRLFIGEIRDDNFFSAWNASFQVLPGEIQSLNKVFVLQQTSPFDLVIISSTDKSRYDSIFSKIDRIDSKLNTKLQTEGKTDVRFINSFDEHILSPVILLKRYIREYDQEGRNIISLNNQITPRNFAPTYASFSCISLDGRNKNTPLETILERSLRDNAKKRQDEVSIHDGTPITRGSRPISPTYHQDRARTAGVGPRFGANFL